MTTETITALTQIVAALERGDGSPVEGRDAPWALRDLVAAIDDADLDDAETVADLLADARGRLVEAQAAELAAEVSARWPSLDHGDGNLRVMAEQLIRDEPQATTARLAEIAREAEEEWAVERAHEARPEVAR